MTTETLNAPTVFTDIEDQMRLGHPYLAETADTVVETVVRNARRLGRPARILEIGCASGILASRVAEALPEAEVAAIEELPELAALARRRLAGTSVDLHTRPFSEWRRPVDVLFSGGAHHHLDPSYLTHARRVVNTDAVYVLGDELCPEYCHGPLAERIAHAQILRFAGGYVLTSAAEYAAWERNGSIPPIAEEMERRRKQALWRWYRFVVDQAMAGGHYEIAIAELTSTSNDLRTGSQEEHKMSPAIVERELALAGFTARSRRILGPMDDPALQSFHVYEFTPEAL
jgi:SAM-dependent methyltransferase